MLRELRSNKEILSSALKTVTKRILVMFFALCTVGTDMLIQITIVVLFVIPLRITIKTLAKLSDDKVDAIRKNAKMAFFGSKIFVLAATASVSTLLMNLFFNFGVTFLFTIDTLINAICVMLMSPYYSGPRGNDEMLYRTLCKPCIVCCCQVKYSLVYHEGKKARHEMGASGTIATSEVTVKTLDTESAARVVAEKQAIELESIGQEKMMQKMEEEQAGSEREISPAPPQHGGNLQMGNVYSQSEAVSEYHPDDEQPQEKGGDIELQVQGRKGTAVDTSSEPTAVSAAESGSAVDPQKESVIGTVTDLTTPSRD